MASPDDIWLVDFGEPYPGEPAHRRPAFVVGPSRVFGDDLPFIIVAPLTTKSRRISFHVEIEPDVTNGLDDVSYVQSEMLRSISKRRLVMRLGMVTMAQSFQVHTVLSRLMAR
jgi:mRNA interferase MazF